VRSHAKASSAGSTLRRAKGLGRIVRGDVATRGGFGDAKGSGAIRARLAPLVLTLVALALVAFAPAAFASKGVVGWAGNSLNQSLATSEVQPGGQFREQRGVAVNSTGAGGVTPGDFYVADSVNNRIEEFHSSGEFVRAWGQDVIGVNERQKISFERVGAGAFTITFDGKTTEPLRYNALGHEVREALEALSTIGPGNVELRETGNPPLQQLNYEIFFVHTLEGTDLPQLTVDSSGLSGESQVIEVKTLIDGFGGVGNHGYEVCEEAAHCNLGSSSVSPAPGGEMSEPQGVAVDQATGDVYVTDSGFQRVQRFSAKGQFEETFGKDVVQSGQPGDTGTGTETCTVASECKRGESGEAGGEFGSSLGYPAVAPAGSPNAGHVYVADPSNLRVQEFTAAGSFVEAFGADVENPAGGSAFEVCTVAAECKAGAEGSANGQFAFNSPNRLAVDDAGRVYAIDNGNSRVQRFTSAPAFDTVYGTTQLSGSPAPTDIAIDPGANAGAGESADDHVFVVKPCDSTLCPADSLPPPFSTEEARIEELGTAADPALIDTHMASDGILRVQGLAVDTVSDRLFASAYFTSSLPPSTFKHTDRVYLVDDPLPAPIAKVTTVTATDTTATLSGSVDPKGGQVNCEFQYSTDQSTWVDVSVAGNCESLANDGGPQPIDADLTGLVPNTHYFVRVQVSRPYPPATTVNSGSKSVDTQAPPPALDNVGATEMTDTSARLVGTIDPKHSSTGYVFEYGTTPALGSSTAPLAIGSGSEPLTISQVVSGLAKDTTYYFRLVATNATGTTTSSGHTLHTRAIPLPLPEQRAYEMVSPPDKNGTDVDHLPEYPTPHAGISRDGEAVGFCTEALFGEEPPQFAGSFCSPYISRRGASGWTTRTPVPRFCRFDFENTVSEQHNLASEFLDDNFDTGVLSRSEPRNCPLGRLDPAALPTESNGFQGNLYRQDLSGDPGSPSSYQLIAPKTPQWLGFVGGNPDFSHVAYHSEVNETDPPDSPAPGDFTKLYDWVSNGDDGCAEAGGCTTLVSKDTSNVPFTTPSDLVKRTKKHTARIYASDGISRDGSRIFFYNPVQPETTQGCPGCDIYMREDDATTYEVSESECTDECGSSGGEASFEAATPSGEIALFLSCDKLTNASAGVNAPCGSPLNYFTTLSNVRSKLYRWDRSAPLGHRLIDLTVDHEPADGTEPYSRQVLGMSEDGNVVYFVADSQLVSGAPIGGGFKLYRWRWNDGDPRVNYLATLSNSEANLDAIIDPRRLVTPDGKFLLMETESRIDPVADQDSTIDVYRWDEEDGWLCISCQKPGVASMGNSRASSDSSSTLYAYGQGATDGATTLQMSGPSALTPRISADGQTVFFDTPDALVPQDVNGEVGCALAPFPSAPPRYVYNCSDVYEWHDGRVSLVSAGTENTPSYLIGMDASGRNAFFYTRQKLVGWDVDNNVDIYDARAGGGFPEPPAQPPACEGESCRGGSTSPPAAAGAGTAAFQGPGDPTPKHAKEKKHRKKHHKHGRHHKRAAKHNRRAAR
jgi:hypothetical protein